MTMKYEIVTPVGQWTEWPSSAMRGRVAIHAVIPGKDKTLCGRYCIGWFWQNATWSDGAIDVNCKTCKRAIGAYVNRELEPFDLAEPQP